MRKKLFFESMFVSVAVVAMLGLTIPSALADTPPYYDTGVNVPRTDNQYWGVEARVWGYYYTSPPYVCLLHKAYSYCDGAVIQYYGPEYYQFVAYTSGSVELYRDLGTASGDYFEYYWPSSPYAAHAYSYNEQYFYDTRTSVIFDSGVAYAYL